MLIVTERHAPRDLAEWERCRRVDKMLAQNVNWGFKIDAAQLEMSRFRPDYIGCSWGKDSVVVAHLAWQLFDNPPPLVFVRVVPRFNPEVDLVRDEFLKRFDWPNYHEIEIQFEPQPDGTWAKPSGRLTSSAGFDEAARRFGHRYVGGIRAEESKTREIRVKGGLTTKNTCAPIGRWTTAEVFAYLEKFNLPIHPAYGYLGGKRWDRNRLRVASLFGDRGTGFGRREWEMQYYGDVWEELRESALRACEVQR